MEAIVAISDLQQCKVCNIKKPFSNFGPSKRHKTGYLTTCRECFNSKLRKLYKENYLQHRDKKLSATNEWRKRNPESERNKHYKRKFGITIEQYNELWENQKGLCAICLKPEKIHSKGGSKPMWLSVDHDHTTGKVRALLCFKCNTTLSYFERNEKSIESIIEYLGKHK